MKISDGSMRVAAVGILLSVLVIALALSVPVSAGMMGGGGCGGGGSSTIIDPPIGAAFKDPAIATDTNPDANIVEVNIEAKFAPVNVNGTIANLMTYNGLFPGPTIKVKSGQKLKIHFTNWLPYTEDTNLIGFQKNLTCLHTHGMHVSPKPPQDFVMYALKCGETYHHEYDTSCQAPGSLTFYHGHKHGVSAEQYWAGMVGAMVFEDSNTALSGFEQHVMVLKDISLVGSQPAPHSSMMDYMNGKEGDIVMVNGQVNPRLYMKTGQVQRWRILNASNGRFYRLSLEGHSMYVIGSDGGLLDKPYLRSEVIMSPGERVDILVKGTQKTGNYRLRALPYSRMMGCMSSNQTVTLLTLTYNGSRTAQSIPTVINSAATRVVMDTSMLPHRTIALSMSMGRGYINGQDFDVDPYVIMSMVGDYEVWTITNNSCMDHPFHQHVNPAQVLSVTGGDAGYASLYTTTPAWKDVVLVPKGGSVTMLVPVMDFDGMAMFHCHILEHEDIGMMGMWHLMMPDDPMPM